MQHAEVHTATHAATHAESQQHPIGIYLKIWALLFVLSTFSYLVDYFHFHGYTRWTLVIIFMLLKAGFIVAIFMHMRWERMALICTILIPPLCLLVLIGMMSIEGHNTLSSRDAHFDNKIEQPVRSTTSHHP